MRVRPERERGESASVWCFDGFGCLCLVVLARDFYVLYVIKFDLSLV